MRPRPPLRRRPRAPALTLALPPPHFARSMIEIYKPDSLIVGTRGRPDSLFKSAFMGSISRCVASTPAPVPPLPVGEALLFRG